VAEPTVVDRPPRDEKSDGGRPEGDQTEAPVNGS
jgi:hypothetical protein